MKKLALFIYAAAFTIVSVVALPTASALAAISTTGSLEAVAKSSGLRINYSNLSCASLKKKTKKRKRYTLVNYNQKDHLPLKFF